MGARLDSLPPMLQCRLETMVLNTNAGSRRRADASATKIAWTCTSPFELHPSLPCPSSSLLPHEPHLPWSSPGPLPPPLTHTPSSRSYTPESQPTRIHTLPAPTRGQAKPSPSFYTYDCRSGPLLTKEGGRHLHGAGEYLLDHPSGVTSKPDSACCHRYRSFSAGSGLSLACCRRLWLLARMLPLAPVSRSHTAAGSSLSLAHCRRLRSLARMLPLASVSRSRAAAGSGFSLACCRRLRSLARMPPPAPLSRSHTAACISLLVTYPGISKTSTFVPTYTSCSFFSVEKPNSWYKSGLVITTLRTLFTQNIRGISRDS